MIHVLGVDGGMSGAFALLGSDGSLTVWDTPCREIEDGHEADAEGILALLRGIREPPEGAFMERGQEVMRVDADGRRHHQNHMYRYGEVNGMVYGVAVALGIKSTLIWPQTWKRHLHLIGQDKEASRAKASELFPDHVKLWPFKKNHNRAEAALIAKYGLDFLEGRVETAKEANKRYLERTCG